MKDHKRLGWGKAHGGVILEEKGLSGHALQLDGETGWVDLGSLDTACPGGACSDDFSISMWFKYHLKGNDEEQTFFTFGEYSALEGRSATGGIAVIKKKKKKGKKGKKNTPLLVNALLSRRFITPKALFVQTYLQTYGLLS